MHVAAKKKIWKLGVSIFSEIDGLVDIFAIEDDVFLRKLAHCCG